VGVNGAPQAPWLSFRGRFTARVRKGRKEKGRGMEEGRKGRRKGRGREEKKGRGKATSAGGL